MRRLAIGIIVIALTGVMNCSDSAPSLVGKWYLVTVEISGCNQHPDYSSEAPCELMCYRVEFRENGTAIYDSGAGPYGITYSTSGNTLTLSTGQTYTYSLGPGTLTLTSPVNVGNWGPIDICSQIEKLRRESLLF